MHPVYQRPFVAQLAERLQQESAFIQILVGPRQVGKTTGVRQFLAQAEPKAHYANADDLLVSDHIG
jgi:predicted AAA+ superfamily ATPase